MVNIEPYDFQKKTNIKEHNDIVAKVNEIVDVINNTNLETVIPRISKLETDVSTIKATDSLQWTDIENLKTKNTEYDTHFGLNDTQIDGITKSLVSDVALMNGTTTGNVKVRIERKDAPSIDSNDYNIQKPTSIELVQGSAPAMVKAQITLSDGTVLISDDFMFTTEAIGQDVYISSFVFKNGNVAGTISADIGLSNGTTLEANNFAVPTDPNVTNAITDLQTRMTAVEGGTIVGLDELKQTVDGHTASISALDSDVANLQIDKADVNNGSQSIVAGSISANNISKSGVAVATVNDIPVVPDISGKVDKAQGIGNAGKVLGIGDDGNVTPVEIKMEKKLYTSPIETLISLNPTTGTVEVLKDFDIEFLYVYNRSIRQIVSTVKKVKYTVESSPSASPASYLTNNGDFSNSNYIELDTLANKIYVKVYSKTATQLTNTNEIISNSAYYYRLWV